MIFALRHPAILLGLVVGFVVGVSLRAAVQRRLTSTGGGRRGGLRGARLRSVGGSPLRQLGPRAGWAAYLDPYGAVAAAIGGVGWGARVPARRSGRGSDFALVVAAVVVHGVLAVAGFAAFNAAGGDYRIFGDLLDATDVLYGGGSFGQFGEDVTAGFAMINLACGLLALLPIPPLEFGVLVWSRLPRSPGARRLAYRLLEEAWGVAIILVLVLLPLAGERPVALALINTITQAIIRQF